MAMIFLDFESTGLEPAVNVPTQAAFIRTDDDLVIQDEVVLCGRVPQHIVPAPDSMLVTSLTPEQLEAPRLSYLELATSIARLLASWAPATVVGFNSLKYDEELLRNVFHQALLPPYATSGKGFRRADILSMLRTLAQIRPSAIKIPVVDGKPVYRLGDVCRFNGIGLGEDEAHDALNDVRATLALFKLMRSRAPDLIEALMENAHKSGAIRRLSAGGIVGLADFGRIVPVTALMPAPNGASWAVADLSIDPSIYLGLSAPDLIGLMGAKGERPIRTVKANAQPMLLPWTPEVGMAATCRWESEAVYNDRLRQIHADDAFWRNLTAALANRFGDRQPSPWPEQRLYDGFPSKEDVGRAARWHELDWSVRYAFGERHIQDDRLRAFSRRLVFENAPETMTPEQWQEGREWLQHRLTTTDPVPWLTLPGAINRCAELRRETADPERLARIDVICRWLEGRLAEMVRPAEPPSL
ncbi:exonuclease domain-containing protein [Bosea thiooxidans]|nr:exonuclease domain-containing protein [Bosea sp. (in: a-proteobacteria)]